MEVYGNLFPHTFRTYSASITLLALVEPFHAFHSHYKCKDVFDSSTDLAAALCLFDPVTFRCNKPFFVEMKTEFNNFLFRQQKVIACWPSQSGYSPTKVRHFLSGPNTSGTPSHCNERSLRMNTSLHFWKHTLDFLKNLYAGDSIDFISTKIVFRK